MMRKLLLRSLFEGLTFIPRSQSIDDLTNNFKMLFSSDEDRAIATDQLTAFMTSPAVHGQNTKRDQQEGFFPGNPYSTAFGLYLMRMSIDPTEKDNHYKTLIKDLDDLSDNIYNNNPRKHDLDKLFIDKSNGFKVGQHYYPTQSYMEEIAAPYLKALGEIKSRQTQQTPAPAQS